MPTPWKPEPSNWIANPYTRHQRIANPLERGTKDEMVKYVGITKRGPAERFAEHLASKTNRSTLKYDVVETGLTKMQARVREQYWINYFGMEKNGGQLYNQINSIAPKYWNNFSIKIEVTNLP